MGRSKKIAIADGSSGSGDGADTTEVAAAIVEDDEEFAALLDAAEARQEPNRERLKLSLKSDGQCCHVCGKKGHRAGFVGSRYVDCINRPCYLCKQVDAAIVKLHSRRCTTLEFHPYRDNLVLSGDKKGQVAVWDFEAVHQRRLFPHINTCLTNNIRFMPESGEECCSAASDGTVKAFDIECGVATTLLDLNPHGYDGVPSHWGMFYGLSVEASTHAVLAGDSHGRVTVMDARQPPGSGAAGACGALQLHRPGTKVVSIDCHPLSSFLVMSAGNDHTARLFDLRKMAGGGAVGDRPASGSKAATQFSPHPAQLAVLQHGRVVNSAVFSPRSGRRILTTCQDNRLRVWDNVGSCWHGPDREIVHSHDFNRYLTPFKAEFDPKDLREATVVIGRYISEDFGGLALHPVDIFDVATGKLTQELVDRNLITICPVNKFHPRRDVIVTGSSRSLFLWRPVSDANEADADADSENTSAGNGSAEAPGMPQSSASFMLFDADHDDDAKKKKRSKAQTATQAQAAAADDDVKKKKRGKAQTATLEQAAAAEDDAKKKKRGKAQTATQAQAAAADDNANKKKRGKAQTASEQQPVGGDDDAKKARKRCTAQTASKQEPVGCDVDNDAKRTKRDSKTPAASTQQAVGGDDSAKKMKNKRGKAHSAMEQQAARPARDERAQTSGSERNSRNPAGADDRKDGGSHRRRKE